MTESVTSLGVTEAPTAEGARPSIDLPIGALIRISAFWLGLTAIDAVVTAAVQARVKFDNLVAPGTEGTALAVVAILVFVFSVAVQPTVGSISDYTIEPLGPAQAVHRRSARCSTSCSSSASRRPTRWSRSPRSSRCSRSARTSPAVRSRATSRTSCRSSRSGWPARWSA